LTQLPPGWASALLGDICEPVSKHNPSERPNDVIRYLDIGGIENQQIGEIKEVAGHEAPSRARQLVHAGDTLLSTVRTYLRKTAFVPPELDGATASTGFCVLRPGLGIEPRFIFYRVIDPTFVAALSGLQTGSSYPAVRDSDVFSREIALPPSSEQRRIVATMEEQFSRLDAAEALLGRSMGRIEVLRTSLITSLIDGDWPLRPWKEIGRSQNGRAFPSRDYTNDGVRLLRPGNLNSSGSVVWTTENTRWLPLHYEQQYPSYVVGPNELVMNLTAQSLKDEFLGRTCLTGPEEHCLLNQRLARLTPHEADVRYLLFVFKARPFRRFVNSLNKGSLIQHMFTSQIAEFEIPLPPLEEQRRVVAEIDRRLSVIDPMAAEVKGAMRRSSALRRAILQRAFSGQLVTQDPSDEPASALLDRIAGRDRTPKTKHRRTGVTV